MTSNNNIKGSTIQKEYKYAKRKREIYIINKKKIKNTKNRSTSRKIESQQREKHTIREVIKTQIHIDGINKKLEKKKKKFTSRKKTKEGTTVMKIVKTVKAK